MVRENATRIRKWLHQLFEASLVIKGLLASAEALAGLGLLLTSNMLILRIVDWLTQYEIAEDPADKMATVARHYAESFSLQTQHFYAWYLLSHGGLKLAMVVALAMGAIWAYPAAMLILAGFVSYQLYTWSHDGSRVLLLLSGFDLVMIGLVWQEFRAKRAAKPNTTPNTGIKAAAKDRSAG